jgi:hypothetical protein
MMTDEDIRQIFLYCENKDPEGLYADEVDVLEFGKKIAAVASVQARRAEREFCVDFVNTLNKEVAKVLAEQKENYEI